MFFSKTHIKYIVFILGMGYVILVIHNSFHEQAKVIHHYIQEEYQEVVNLLGRKEKKALRDKDLSHIYARSLIKLGRISDARSFLDKYRRSNERDEHLEYLYKISLILDTCSYFIRPKGLLKSIIAYEIEPVINDNYSDILDFYDISLSIRSSNQLFFHNRDIIISHTLNMSENRTDLIMDLLSLDIPGLLDIVLENIKRHEAGLFTDSIIHIFKKEIAVDRTLMIELLGQIEGYDARGLIEESFDASRDCTESIISLFRIMKGMDYSFANKYIEEYIQSSDPRLKSAAVLLLRNYIFKENNAMDRFKSLLVSENYDIRLYSLLRTIILHMNEEQKKYIIEEWDELHSDIREIMALSSVPGNGGDVRGHIGQEKGISWSVWKLLIDREASSDKRPAPDLNLVILVSVDTLRRDHLSFYGYRRNTMPGMAEIIKAKKGLVFENFYSNSSWTLPSHVSMLSGLSPVDHGVNGRDDRIGGDLDYLPDLLGEHDYLNIAFVTHSFVSQSHNFNRNFDFFYYNQEEIAESVISKAVRAIDYIARKGITRNLFVFIHLYDCHSPYTPRKEFDVYKDDPPFAVPGNMFINEQQNLYDGEILYVDSVLSEFYRQMNTNYRTVFILTSDHGEEFLEHGGVLHGATLYREVVEIPFIVIGDEKKLQNISAYKDLFLSNRDTPYLLCRLVGIKNHSYSLEDDFVEMLLFKDNIKKYSYIQKKLKIKYDMISSTFSLYDIKKDRDEKKPLCSSKYRHMEELSLERTEDYLEKEVPAGIEMTEEQLEVFRALGYIG